MVLHNVHPVMDYHHYNICTIGVEICLNLLLSDIFYTGDNLVDYHVEL